MKEVFVFNSYRALPGFEEAVGSALQRIAVKVKAEPGCRLLQICRSIADPGHYMVYMCWADEAALDRAMKRPFVIEFLDQIELLTGHPLNALFTNKLD